MHGTMNIKNHKSLTTKMDKASSHRLRSYARVDFVLSSTYIDVTNFGVLSVSYELLLYDSNLPIP